jgi:hypothetical protein
LDCNAGDRRRRRRGSRARAPSAPALSAVPAWVVVLVVALHLATLVLRSEAWRLSLAAGGGEHLTREVLHGANAAAFAAGTVQSQAALPARCDLARAGVGDVVQQRSAEQVVDLGAGVFDRADRVTGGLRRGDRSGEDEFGGVVDESPERQVPPPGSRVRRSPSATRGCGSSGS